MAPGADLGGPTLYYDPCQFAPVVLGYFGSLARNTVILPGTANFALSLMKNFVMTESSRIEFRAEFFNLFNRVNQGSPLMVTFRSNGTVDPAGGQILTTRTKAREIQFGLKYSF